MSLEMRLNAKFYKSTLNFIFDAGTSRGVLKKKDSYFIKIWYTDNPACFGLGESGPLAGLSLDFFEAENELKKACEYINNEELSLENLDLYLNNISKFPSVCFALETAFFDLQQGGFRRIFSNSNFYENGEPIEINGLVWMGKKDFMLNQVKTKIEEGFKTIKLKIGAIDFEEELSILKYIRNSFKPEDIEIRLDANGAFQLADAYEKLKTLSDFHIHSIEQPIMKNQIEYMAELCRKSPIPIALDEELIGNQGSMEYLLKEISPAYIILKPSLLGGIKSTKKWIQTAENMNIGWWITSALESNVGLNAICQLCDQFQNPMPQGLGTGKLFDNNFPSPLHVYQGYIHYEPQREWDLSHFS